MKKNGIDDFSGTRLWKGCWDGLWSCFLVDLQEGEPANFFDWIYVGLVFVVTKVLLNCLDESWSCFPVAAKVKESANFKPRCMSNTSTKVYRVAFCSCNLLNRVEVVICKFWVNYPTNSWEEILFWAAAYWSVVNPAAIIFGRW